MAFHRAPLFGRKRCRLEQDVIADPGLAQIVNQSSQSKVARITTAPADIPSQALSICRNAPRMLIRHNIALSDAIRKRKQYLADLLFLMYFCCYHLGTSLSTNPGIAGTG